MSDWICWCSRCATSGSSRERRDNRSAGSTLPSTKPKPGLAQREAFSLGLDANDCLAHVCTVHHAGESVEGIIDAVGDGLVISDFAFA